jgi:drug/metabolite transporter (DMT)-like permease
LYPIAAGFFGFAATVVGSHFFRLSHPYYYIALGILFFLICNHLLYKLKFNSYYSNGSTVTTTLVFTSQVVSMAIYKMEGIGWKWIIGVIFILIGTVLIEPKTTIN